MSRRQFVHMSSYHLHGQTIEDATHTKYLGVTLSNDMKWNEHIQNATNKANKTLGFLKRNIKTSNKCAKLTAYKALVRPILEYGGAVWDPYTTESVNNIEKVQRRAARWITSKYDADIEEDMSALGLTSLANRRKQARLSAFYKIHHGQIKISTRIKTQLSKRRHSTRTAHSQTYNIEHSRTNYRQMSFFPRTAREWNKLPDNIVSASSHEQFLNLLGAHRTAQHLSPA